MKLRSIVVAVVCASGVLTACGASPPPAKELAEEVVLTLEITGAQADCMRAAIEGFPAEGIDVGSYESLDEIAAAADDGNDQAKELLAAFQSALADCTG